MTCLEGRRPLGASRRASPTVRGIAPLPTALRRILCLVVATSFGLAACSGGGAGTESADAGSPAAPTDANVQDTGGEDAGLADTGPDSSSIWSNVVSSDAPDVAFEGETEVAAAGSNVVAVWIATTKTAPYGAIGYAISRDYGQSFAKPGRLESPGSRTAGDPSIAVAPDGTFYAAWLGLRYLGVGDYGDGGTYGAVLAPGENAFGTPFSISDPADAVFYDKTNIAVTPAGTVLASYNKSPDSSGTQPSSLIVARSTTQGATWNRTTAVQAQAGEFFTSPVACPDLAGSGHVVLVFWGYDATGVRIFMTGSDDDGKTWSPRSAVSLPGEAVSGSVPACRLKGADLWIAYALSHGSSNPVADLPLDDGIVVAHSTDGGASFPERFDAFDSAAGTYAVNPGMLVDVDGDAHVGFYAGDSAGDPNAAFDWRHLVKGAFTKSTVLAEPIQLVTTRTSSTWLGDYVGSAVDGNRALWSFTDNQTGTSHIRVVSAPLP